MFEQTIRRLENISSHLIPHNCVAQVMASTFDTVPTAPVDPILGITQAYNADTSPNKVNLGVGAYRDDNGKPYVLKVVRKVEQQLVNNPNIDKEYIPIDGLPDFVKLTSKLILGDNSPALKEGRVVTAQSLSGTGALRIGTAFIKQFFPQNTTVLLSNPTWANHQSIMNHAGVPFKLYRYWSDKTKSLDFEGLIEDLNAAPEGSVVLLHVCAHNPTGVDPTKEQWQKIANVMQSKKLFPFFDCAYQGFATGDLDGDAYAVRLFVERGFELFVTQSYAKNIGLYGERIGAFNIVLNSTKNVEAVRSQVKVIIRAMYSSPPAWGARIVATVLGNTELFNEWVQELKMMSHRIKEMRQALYNRLKENGTPGNWNHIVDQIGMFSYTGLNAAQCDILTKKYHVYLVSNGRVSMAGFNSKNFNYVADAIKDAVTSSN